jgi:TonB family protein
MLTVGLIALVLAAQEQVRDVRKLVGQTATVCGVVRTYGHPEASKRNCTVRFDIGSPDWQPRFYVLIPEQMLAAFATWPETTYVGQDVCVTGPIVRGKQGVPHVVISSTQQIVPKAGTAPPVMSTDGIYRGCDKAITEPHPVRETRPDYPVDLLRQRVEGTVLLDAVVATDGTVSQVRTIFARQPEFGPAAEKAIRQWRFKPAAREGKPVAALVLIEMEFRLQ